MTQLKIRQPVFRIDESVPFQWQPANPAFGIFANVFTFLAIAFERYIVISLRKALPLVSDPEVAAEADAFLRQEAQHAGAHRVHAKALIGRYPGLEHTLAGAHAAYDELLAQQPLAFHLAYIADLEASFTPLFKLILDHRGAFFEGGDERVGTLMLWHFVEEIEHRSSALIVYRHLVPDRMYRLRLLPRVIRHVSSIYDLVLDGFDAVVPLADRHLPLSEVRPNALWRSELRARLPLTRKRATSAPRLLGQVPGRDLRALIWRLMLSQLPGHDPAHEPLPAWAQVWHEAYDAGGDVASYTGVRLRAGAD